MAQGVFVFLVLVSTVPTPMIMAQQPPQLWHTSALGMGFNIVSGEQTQLNVLDVAPDRNHSVLVLGTDYTVPASVQVTTINTFNSDASRTTIFSSQLFAKSLGAKVGLKVPPEVAGVSFGASTSVSNMHNSLSGSNRVAGRMTATYTGYTLAMTSGTPASAAFTTAAYSANDFGTWNDFFSAYGTHYITTAVVGGEYILSTTFSSSNSGETEKNGWSAGLDLSVVSGSVSQSKSQIEKSGCSDVDVSFSIKGGNVAARDLDDWKASFSQLHASSPPDLIDYTLASVCALVANKAISAECENQQRFFLFLQNLKCPGQSKELIAVNNALSFLPASQRFEYFMNEALRYPPVCNGSGICNPDQGTCLCDPGVNGDGCDQRSIGIGQDLVKIFHSSSNTPLVVQACQYLDQCWNLNNGPLNPNDNYPLKSGAYCAVGRFEVPRGITVKTFSLWGSWGVGNEGDKKCITEGDKYPVLSTVHGPERAPAPDGPPICMFYFTVSPGYSCVEDSTGILSAATAYNSTARVDSSGKKRLDVAPVVAGSTGALCAVAVVVVVVLLRRRAHRRAGNDVELAVTAA